MPLGPGAQLGPYEILEPLGRGGMGEVYRARHRKLQRDVAIKVLPAELADDPARLARFEREARTASALNHPNIVTIHDIAEDHGTTYIAMELVEGRTLRELIAEGPVPVDTALEWAQQLTDGLARAHAAGIVHRDIKPANVMVTNDGLVKILDFGLAKAQRAPRAPDGAGATQTSMTREGVVVGTPHYMSPEQCVGDTYDHRSDQFALGIVLYEMLGGKPPFDGPSARAIISAIITESPVSLHRLRGEVPAELERIIARCLAKEPSDRFPATTDLAAELRRCAARRARPGVWSIFRRPAVAASLAGIVVVLAGSGWIWVRGAGARWAAGPAINEINGLTEKGDLFNAYITAVRAEAFRPHDPTLQQVVERITLPVLVGTEPPGAEVQVSSYGDPDSSWVRLGVTPLTLRIPYALMRWRITKPGYIPFVGAPFGGTSLVALGDLHLDSAGTLPPGMVRVPGGGVRLPAGLSPPPGEDGARVGTFLLDRFEVTNRAYRAFVVAGGYDNPKWWPSPIRQDDTTLSWADAKRRFVDATGQPGPATWEAGTYPDGEDDYPVSGISWYEAAAYCSFAGKALPTIWHWMRAIGQDQMSDILRYSNFEGNARAPVGQFQGLGAYGTYDMAGNVKEWTWNASGSMRYLLGGAWNEPGYVFRHLLVQEPMRRDSTQGVRCARYPQAPPASLLAPATLHNVYPQSAPLSDAAFAVLRASYAYDRNDLEARADWMNDSLPDYRREVVSIRTAYGDGRMEINLLIPRNVEPPYQSVILVPGSDVFAWRSSASFATTYLFDFIPRAGRVLVYPIYDGTYERYEPPPGPGTARGRDQMIHWEQDLSRTIDYLSTRPDFDSTRIAYYGISGGAWIGPVFTAIEPRFRASVLFGGGLIPVKLAPQIDPVLFAPRSHVPTLMINGIDDFLMPYEESEKPFFDLLGVPDSEKTLDRLDGGHMPANRLQVIRDVLDWLDRWLGPVQRAAPVVAGNREGS